MIGNETCNANEAKNRSSLEIPIISENLQPKISEFLKSASQGILEKVLRGKLDKPVWKPTGRKPKTREEGCTTRLDSMETPLPSRNATTKKMDTSSSNYVENRKNTTFATWNVNSGSESHRKLASVWAQANMFDILILPEGGSLHSDATPHETYRTAQTQTHRGGVR
eukprot:GHVP01048266.1.p1 GENE.GHVP01048266.1~~GHVP01048266.1.p1  ORF type:complete len:167 (+),score=27.65 GHVP01048266.1:309-809(+)